MPIAMLIMSQVEQAQAEQRSIPPPPAFLHPLFATFLVLLLALVVSLGFGARHVLALGYDIYTRRLVASALMSGPTARRALWKKPEVARALLPPRAAAPELGSEPRLPREYARAIARVRGAGEAEALVTEIAAIDAEIERLAADADPQEAERLRQKLDGLGAEAAEDGDERKQRRRLLRDELDLVAKVEARIAEARARRESRLAALREMWRSATTPAGGGTETATRTAER